MRGESIDAPGRSRTDGSDPVSTSSVSIAPSLAAFHCGSVEKVLTARQKVGNNNSIDQRSRHRGGGSDERHAKCARLRTVQFTCRIQCTPGLKCSAVREGRAGRATRQRHRLHERPRWFRRLALCACVALVTCCAELQWSIVQLGM